MEDVAGHEYDVRCDGEWSACVSCHVVHEIVRSHLDMAAAIASIGPVGDQGRGPGVDYALHLRFKSGELRLG